MDFESFSSQIKFLENFALKRISLFSLMTFNLLKLVLKANKNNIEKVTNFDKCG
jgi:hypothetical protein